MVEIVNNRNTVGKGENADVYHFLHFSAMISIEFNFRIIKTEDYLANTLPCNLWARYFRALA